jgi:GDP-D-mannose 3',5'-epimerase
VRGVDLKQPEFWETQADDFVLTDLRDSRSCIALFDQRFDEIYQLAADMGGAGYVFTGENDAQIMHNSAMINLNMLEACKNSDSKRIFYSSSACIYPQDTQQINIDPELREETAYPGNPDSEYGWEKLFSERLYFAYQKNYGLEVRVARYHNIFRPIWLLV